MTEDKDFKRLVRERAKAQGTSYVAARRQLQPPVTGGTAQAPAHWELRGTDPENFRCEIDPGETYRGKPIARLTYIGTTLDGPPSSAGMGMMLQEISARELLGCRIRFEGELRLQAYGIGGAVAHLTWPDRPFAVEDMRTWRTSGTVDWNRFAIELDVPHDDTAIIVFGLVLQGRGSVSVADMSLGVVAEPVAATGHLDLPTRPQNLDLAEVGDSA